MLNELYKAIREDVPKEPVVQDVYHDGNKYLFDDQAHKFNLIKQSSKRRLFKADDLASLVQLTKELGNVVAGERFELDCSIWISTDAVVLLLDNEDRRENVTLNLSPSAQMLTLRGMQPDKGMFQREFVRMLQVVFQDCIVTPTVVSIAKNVKWTTGGDEDSTVEHKGVSIGKKNAALASGVDVIPEFVELKVPIFASHHHADLTATVKCYFEIDAEKKTFNFLPCAKELPNAILSGQRQLRGLVTGYLGEGSYIPVFFGKPDAKGD